jgi:hypothetical protein
MPLSAGGAAHSSSTGAADGSGDGSKDFSTCHSKGIKLRSMVLALQPPSRSAVPPPSLHPTPSQLAAAAVPPSFAPQRPRGRPAGRPRGRSADGGGISSPCGGSRCSMDRSAAKRRTTLARAEPAQTSALLSSSRAARSNDQVIRHGSTRGAVEKTSTR